MDQFFDKLYALDDTKLTTEQKPSLHLNLEKLRSMLHRKMKLLK